jgi:hypothetical protein
MTQTTNATKAADMFKVVIETPDGVRHDSKADAVAHMRKPLILAAFMAATNNNVDLSNWLVENRETVEVAFETGTIQRVTKSEAKKLSDSLDHIAEALAGDKKAAFVVTNIAAIKDSFRWPSVKRMTEEEKATAARNTLVAASNNEDLADYVLSNKDALLACYSAGIEKREVAPAAKAGLEAYRQKMAAEKKAKEDALAVANTAEEADAAN